MKDFFHKIKRFFCNDPDPHEADSVGMRYLLGEGLPKDHAKAFACFMYAANEGIARAQCNLALCYEKGLGTMQNKKAALAWYIQSARKGYARAQYNVGYA